MKKILSIILILITCLIICACENTKVTFNYNCPGVSNYECSVLDKKLNCTFTLPECNGKEFTGWYDNPSNGNRINLDKDFEESTTLYAHWSDEKTVPFEPTDEEEPIDEIRYTITFNLNGGSGGQTTPIEVKYEETLPQISEEKPIKEGYIFKGWYDNSDYTRGIEYYDTEGKSLRLYDKKNDLILYAGWEKDNSYVEPEPTEETKYEITFNLNGGSGTLPNDISIEYNETLPSISSSNPTRIGYEFTGWYDNSDYTNGNKYYSTDGTPVRNFNRKSDMTLYAGWKIKTYTITYNLNGGSNGQTGGLGVEYNGELPTISKSIPTRSGYTFTGWYDNSDYTKGKEYYNSRCEAVRTYDKTANIILYAGWKQKTLSIEYNGNGGTWNSKNANYYVNSEGTVILKSTNQIYKKDYNYGTELESSGLTDCNGSWFSWKKDGYIVEKGKEYFVQNGSKKTVLDQAKVYSVNDLVNYGGCDLSKSNCTIIVKVNWKKNTYADYGPCKIALKRLRVNHDNYEYGICVPEQYNGQKMPLIYFLHGMNSDPENPFYTNFSTWSNRDFNGVINNWPKYGLKNIPAIIVMPWSKEPDKWNNKYMFRLVNEVYNDVISNYNIDTDNVCLMGHSIGGQGVFTVAAEFPTYFKSIVAMSALITKPGAGDIEYFKNMPMKGFAEKYVPTTHSEYYNYEKKMIELFNNIGHPNDLRVVPVKHGSVPEYALTIDENGDGISDLIYWAINGGKDPEL